MCCACISIFSVCSLLNTAAFAAEWERADAVACRRTTRYSNKYVICMIAVCANLWGSTNLTYQNKLLNFEEMARVYPALASPSTKKSSNRHADTHSTHVYAQVWWKKWRHTHREKGKKIATTHACGEANEDNARQVLCLKTSGVAGRLFVG